MTAAEYEEAMQQMLLLGRIVLDMPLDRIRSAICTADAVGSILDPTLYMKASKKMHDFGRLAASLRPFQEEVRRQLAEISSGRA